MQGAVRNWPTRRSVVRRSARKRRRLQVLTLLFSTALLIAVAANLAFPASVEARAYSLLDSADTSQASLDPEIADLELGVRFTVTRAAKLTGLRFFKAPGDIDRRTITLWHEDGRRIAETVTDGEGRIGWQEVSLGEVELSPGVTYVASYRAKRYMSTEDYFTKTRTVGPLVVPAGANGVYGAGSTFPTKTYRSSNYWIDLTVESSRSTGRAWRFPRRTPTLGPSSVQPKAPLSTPDANVGSPSQNPSPPESVPAATPSPAPTAVPSTPNTAPLEATSPSTSAGEAVIPPVAPVESQPASLSLPRIPWDGGPAYYRAFLKAVASGWSDPGHFPIAVFLGKPEHASQLRSLGVNTYMGAEHDGSRISVITGKGISVLAQDEWTAAELGDDPGVVAHLVTDECDMGIGCSGSSAQANLLEQQNRVKALRARGDGRFMQANYGNGVLRTYWAIGTMRGLVDTVDVSSVDKYAYTSPHVQGIIPDSPDWPKGAKVASSATYGWLASQLASFGDPAHRKPSWVFVETGKPFLTESGAKMIKPEQIEGAVWSAIIHEARGIAYFQHNNDKSCGVYSLLQCDPAIGNRVKIVNAKIAALSPVINTQSYVWEFGAGVDTMLKTYDGDAYIFAGVGLNQSVGQETFTLPSGVGGTSVTVVGENRTIPVANGRFTDFFANEWTTHVYRVSIG